MTTPDRRLLTQKEACFEMDVSAPTFRKWGCQHVETSGRTKFYSIADIVRAYHRYHLSQRPAPEESTSVGSGVAPDYWEEQTRKVRADRIAREFKNGIDANEITYVETAGAVLDSVVGSIVTILTSIPLNIKREHPSTPIAVISQVEREIIAARNKMAEVDIEFPAVDDQ